MAGKLPPKPDESRTIQVAPARGAKPAESKKVNCFAMDRPLKPGMIPVSTGQVLDGCYILAWEPQNVTMLVTEAPEWYAYAAKILKANLIFSAVFALALLIVLVLNRAGR